MNKVKNKVLSIVIVILTIVLFVTVIVTIARLRQTSYHYSSSVKMMVNELSRGDYENLVRDYTHNLEEGITAEKNREYTEIYAVAEYYIQASRVKVYMECGYNDELAKSKAIMEECLAKMGDIAYYAEQIDELFGLNY